MLMLDRPGIFKAKPMSWWIRTADQSNAVAVCIDFHILAQLDGEEWASWESYDEHSITGDFWVVKKDGAVNAPTVQSLVKALGWSGDLKACQGKVPDTVVQIVVKLEQYNGRERVRVQWINPGDYSPGPAKADEGEVTKLQGRFGSLLRAAASSVQAEGGAKGKAPPPAAKATESKEDDDDLPF